MKSNRNHSILITVLMIFILGWGCSHSPIEKQVSLEFTDKLIESKVPIWKQRLMIWPNSYESNKPWRTDSRLIRLFEKNYPDDIPVVFVNLKTTAYKPEVMWVTVINYDPVCDLYLGILINEPYHMSDPSEGDVIVFRFDPTIQRPTAISEQNSYRMAATPSTSDKKFLDAVLAGVRAYRQGKCGHNMPKIEKCIDILSHAVLTIPPNASAEEQFAAHFALARCYAEKYETKSAIDQFKAAIKIAPNDVDAQMGFLAELTLMVHKQSDKPWSRDQAAWDKAFIDQLSTVRSEFGTYEQVKEMIYFIFKKPDSNTLSQLTKEDMERSQKFGYGIFRWKMK